MGKLAALVVALGLMLAPAPSRAQAAGGAEILFWNGAQQDNTAESYRAYLEAYPTGTFASLARRRLERLAGGGAPAAPAAPAGGPAETPAPQPVNVWVRAAKPTIRVIDGVAVELDATGLRLDGNWRVGIVPASWPDGAPPDRAWLLENSVGVPPALYRVTIPAGPPGQDEVRLYWIPRYADEYQVAARAAITVLPGVPGAVLMRELAREAGRLGPIRFEAVHRDKPMLIQAAFLRIRPQTEWNLSWFSGRLLSVSSPAAVINVGQVGALPDLNGSKHEGVCLLPAEGPMLDRLAQLNPGDEVVLRAIPTSWSSAGRASPVLLDRCELLERKG